jgi:putative peptide zinc metalloprotease protein
VEDGTVRQEQPDRQEDVGVLWARPLAVGALDEHDPPPPVPERSPAPPPVRPAADRAALPPGPERLEEATVVRPRPIQPQGGWRGRVHRLSGGLLTPRPSRAEQAWDDLVVRCQAPCTGGRRVAVISRKGGVGKTTTTLMVGHTLAAVRRDRVLAIDGNPDAGTLAHRVTRQVDATVVDALTRAGSLTGYPQARALTSQAPSRLEVLASPQDPHASRALRGADYRRVMDAVDLHYSVVLVDTGTGITDDANLGILDAVDQIVLVSGTALDSARAASLTLDWLQANGRRDLVAEAVVVINAVAAAGRIDVDQVLRHFAGRCRAVHLIPFDRHLDAGATTDPDALAPGTQRAWLEVAASVVDGFASPSRRGSA